MMTHFEQHTSLEEEHVGRAIKGRCVKSHCHSHGYSLVPWLQSRPQSWLQRPVPSSGSLPAIAPSLLRICTSVVSSAHAAGQPGGRGDSGACAVQASRPQS